MKDVFFSVAILVCFALVGIAGYLRGLKYRERPPRETHGEMYIFVTNVTDAIEATPETVRHPVHIDVYDLDGGSFECKRK